MTSPLRQKLFKVFDCINEYSLYLLIFFIPISTAAIESSFGFLLLSCILKKSLIPEFKFLKSRINLFLLFFVLFMAASLFNNTGYTTKSLEALFFKWLEYIMIFLIAQDTLSNRPRVRNALTVLIVSSVIAGVSAITQKIFGIEFLRHRHMVEIYGGFYGITGPFQHYNDFGAYLVAICAIVSGLLLSKAKTNIKFTLLTVELFLLTCLLLTFSRGSFLALILALILMLAFSRKFNPMFLLIFVAVMILLFLPGLKERIVFTFQLGGDTERFSVWKGVWKMIKDNPFLGKGLGTFMTYFPNYVPDLTNRYAHNCFLQIWAETGIFSLLSFLGFVSLILIKAIKEFQKNKDFIILGVICAIFGLLVHSFFDNDLYSLQLAVLFWFLLSLPLANSKIM